MPSRTDNYSGGLLRLSLTPELAQRIGRAPGTFRLRIGATLRARLVSFRDALPGITAPTLGQAAVHLLESATTIRRMRTPATTIRTALSAELTRQENK